MKRLRMLWNYEYQVEFIVLIRRFILDKTSFVKAWLCLISHSVKNHNSSNWYILLPRSINIVERLGFCAEKDLTSHKRGEKLILVRIWDTFSTQWFRHWPEQVDWRDPLWFLQSTSLLRMACLQPPPWSIYVHGHNFDDNGGHDFECSLSASNIHIACLNERPFCA